MKYVLVYERALESAYAIGPFATEEQADAYAKEHHKFPQVWRAVQLKEPTATAPST